LIGKHVRLPCVTPQSQDVSGLLNILLVGAEWEK
jgi:hypothetical protein